MNGTIFGIGPMEVLVIAILVLLVFGPERVPSLMRDLGRSLRKLREYYVAFSTELKREMEPFQEDIKGIQQAAEGLREDLNAIREAADIRGIITAADLEPAKPETTGAASAATSTQTIMPPPPTPSTAATNTAPAESSVPVASPLPSATAAQPVQALPVYAPVIPHNGSGIQLDDENPWAQADHQPRADKLDDDNPWAS